MVRVRRIGVALLRDFEKRERRIEITQFELRTGAQHQRSEVLVGVYVDALEYGEHAYWIAHNQGSAREQNAETIALRKTRNSGFEHPERVRGFSRTHHQCRDFSQFFGSFRACALQFGARITQCAYIPTRKRIVQRLARSLQRI